MLRHYRKPLTITAVARVLSVSPRQLQRAYARFGEGTFREDLIAARMRNAARVLAEYPAIPISDVGRLVGYSQGPHFFEGVSPPLWPHACAIQAGGGAGTRPGACHAQGEMSGFSVVHTRPQMHEGEGEGDGRKAMAEQSKRLRNSIISLAVFFGLVAALLLGVPGLRSVADRIADASPGWVLGAVGFELLSCAGYVVVFMLLFGKLGRFLGTRLALSELAVNAVVSAGGLGGLALGAWVLRSKGISVEIVAKRSVMLFMLTSAVNVLAVLIIGLGMWAGLLPGSTDPLLTLAPALAALAAIVATLAVAAWAGSVVANTDSEHRRLLVALRALSEGVWDVVQLLRRRDPRLLGAVGYWLFDTLVLYACLLAYGKTTSFWIVAVAYLIGMLANSVPIPGGFVAVEGGLVGMLVLFGVGPASLVLAAVITYRAIALWVPSVIGSLAFLSIRREIGKPLRPQARSS